MANSVEECPQEYYLEGGCSRRNNNKIKSANDTLTLFGKNQRKNKFSKCGESGSIYSCENEFKTAYFMVFIYCCCCQIKIECNFELHAVLIIIMFCVYQVVEARKGYVRRVSSVRVQELGESLHRLIQSSKITHNADPLFECLLVVGLDRDPKNGIYHPYIREKFPRDVSNLNLNGFLG